LKPDRGLVRSLSVLFIVSFILASTSLFPLVQGDQGTYSRTFIVTFKESFFFGLFTNTKEKSITLGCP